MVRGSISGASWIREAREPREPVVSPFRVDVGPDTGQSSGVEDFASHLKAREVVHLEALRTNHFKEQGGFCEGASGLRNRSGSDPSSLCL